MEKLLIICEKRTAADNFVAALGGKDGMFEGDEYHIMNLYGHVLTLPQPEKVAIPSMRESIGGFSNISSLPWKFSYFDFDKKVVKGDFDAINKVVRECGEYLKKGYVPVIATDIDDMREGDLIGHEILNFHNYKGVRYREEHIDETPKEIIRALKNKKVVSLDDVSYKMALFRSSGDYLTQSLTRKATMTVTKQGYNVKFAVPVGRLQSVILYLVGSQIKAIEEYVPSSTFESRYKLDSLILSNSDVEKFKSKDLWTRGELPETTKVKKVREVPGTTKPPKPLNFSKLTSLLTKKGYKGKDVKDVYQKMYEAGYLSYPRTADYFISPSQFEEMLPHVDTFINLLGLPVDVFTHRSLRSTHVKEGGSHGALRPGLKIPSSLDTLSNYGELGVEIYKIVTEKFLMMFLEDTEWVRHEYETETTPVFKGSVKIVTKQGVVSDEDETDEVLVSVLPDLSKEAELFIHEAKSVKPTTPTTDWLLKQLEKHNVGTPATQTQKVLEMCGDTTKPIHEVKNKLSLTKLGWLGYETALGTTIGSIDGTKKMIEIVNRVSKGESFELLQKEFEQIVADDVEVIGNKIYNLEKYGFERDRVQLVWNNKNVTIKNTYSSYTYTEDDLRTLAAGGEIEFQITTKKGTYDVVGKLAELVSDKGVKYVGLDAKFSDKNKIKGVWNGQEVSFKNEFAGHKWTDDEAERLLLGQQITIESNGKRALCKLGPCEYNGHKYIGIVPEFENLAKNRVEGMWNGKKISFNRVWSGHEFTDEEVVKLLNGDEIIISYKNKNGETKEGKGKLAQKEWNGKTFVAFDLSRSSK